MSMPHKLLLLLLCATLGFGCDPAQEANNAQRTRAARLELNISADTIKAAAKPQEQLIAVRPDGGLIFGIIAAPQAETDEHRHFTARYHAPAAQGAQAEHEAAKLQQGLDKLGPITALHSLPDRQTLLIITEDHKLLALEGDALTQLDAQVQGPLSVSPSGRYLAYSRGEEPTFEVARYDMAQRQAQTVSAELLGCWSAAVNDEGQVVFMSAASGYTELYATPPKGGAPVKLTSLEQGQQLPTPTGPSAPLLIGQRLYFEDAQGLHMLDLKDPKQLATKALSAQARELVWAPDASRVWSHIDGQLIELSLRHDDGGER